MERLRSQPIEEKGTPNSAITLMEHKRWRQKEGFGAPALPPDKWENLSPRLAKNPNANLKEQQEFRWYLGSLSEQKQREVRSLAIQMRPIEDNVRAVVCIPVRREGSNIYRTLANYVGQVELDSKDEGIKKPLNYSKVRIVVFDNWFEGADPDDTEQEVGRFTLDHPDIPLDYVKGQFRSSVDRIGHVRNMIVSAVVQSSIDGREKPRGDLIYISNDGDMPENAIKPNYVSRIIREFDTHARADALLGKIDMPEEQMSKIPVQFATRTLWQMMTLLKVGKGRRITPFLVGRNMAARLKIIAAVGNYSPSVGVGEDVELGDKIKWIRSWNGKKYDFDLLGQGSNSEATDARIRYTHSVAVETDPRRDLMQLVNSESIFGQYRNGNFRTENGIREASIGDLTQRALKKGLGVLSAKQLQKEITPFYEDAVGSKTLDLFKRAMGFLGVVWTDRDGSFKILNTSRLERGIVYHQLKTSYKSDVEALMGREILGVYRIPNGENNFSFLVKTKDQKEFIIRVSNFNNRKKFSSEKTVVNFLSIFDIPVPKIVCVEEQGSIIPGRTLSMSEKLPGETFQRDYVGENPITKDFLAEVGNALNKIHSISFGTGYGAINERGKGKHSSWSEFILAYFRKEKIEALCYRDIMSKDHAGKIARLLDRISPFLENTSRQLLHGDFTLANILQKDGKLTGIIDFENAKFGDPLFDIAKFVLYEKARIGGDAGVGRLLRSYGQPDFLRDKNNWIRYQVYKLANIIEGLSWYSQRPNNRMNIDYLQDQLRSTLRKIEPILTNNRQESSITPINRNEINSLLHERFEETKKLFETFYWKVGGAQDKEFILVQQILEEKRDFIKRLLDSHNVQLLFDFLKSDEKIKSSGFSDREVRRQIERTIELYKQDKSSFEALDENNPLFRLLSYLRNRGRLSRYTCEYSNLPKEIDFREIVLGLARRKNQEEATMKVLDIGGTMDVGIQQLAGFLKAVLPQTSLSLYSVSADDMAIRFSDCHKYPVDHKVADAHFLSESFKDKQTLIISQATWKFLFDPLGAIVEVANALEKGGWAFIGDIRDKTHYRIFEMIKGKDGKAIDPQRFFEHLNMLNLGFKFYTGMHTSTRDGEPRQVMTLAIKKETNNNLVLPISYGKSKREIKGKSPLAYLLQI